MGKAFARLKSSGDFRGGLTKRKDNAANIRTVALLRSLRNAAGKD